jgi:sigma-B regulation protein RsbU (phosphoserine phosphatase)
MEALYNYTELIEKKEIEREVGIAADIQKWFLPAELPKIDGLDVAAASYPARGVSGDYYDVLPIPQKKGEGKGKAAVLICDVAGKGVPASLVMVMIRTIVHLIAGAGRSAGQIAGLVNRGVAGNVSIERFATFSYLMCDPASGAVEYANAGHHPLLLYRAAGDEFEKVDADGLPIGLDKKSSYSQVEVQLEPGDIALLYTDGIVEAMNAADEQFGEDRVREVLRGNGTSAASAEEIMRKLYDELESFVDGAPQHDDETLIVMKKV